VTTRRKFIASGILAGIGLGVADAFWLEKYFIDINHLFTGHASKDRFDLKVVQVSDLHIQSVSPSLKRLAGKINALQPDLILITGDAIDNRDNMDVLDQFLQLLAYDIRKVAITGNWEYWGTINLVDLQQLYARHNGELLINQSKQFAFRDKTITITGVDDYVGGHADITSAMQTYQSGDYHIILNHCPAYADDIIKKLAGMVPVDLILSGHTHGGQVNLLGFVPFKPQGSGLYLKGWYHDRKMYVSRGIGTSILPVRFMARAELPVFYM
jgi:predicted MPP superfamily phosphohydrolase